jgi:protein-tyrosine phosphatase
VEVYEILKGQLFQSGAPQEAADWQPVLDRGIDVVVDLYGTLDANVPTRPNSILYIFWPIADVPELPDMRIMDVLVDAVIRLIRLEHKVLVHCHMGKSRSGLFNALVAMKVLGISGADAVDLVRRQRPGSLGNQVFAAYLQGLPAPSQPDGARTR